MIALLALAALLAAGIAGVAVFLLKLQRAGQEAAAGGGGEGADVAAAGAVGWRTRHARAAAQHRRGAVPRGRSAPAPQLPAPPTALPRARPPTPCPDRSAAPTTAGRGPARRHGPHARGAPAAAAGGGSGGGGLGFGGGGGRRREGAGEGLVGDVWAAAAAAERRAREWRPLQQQTCARGSVTCVGVSSPQVPHAPSTPAHTHHVSARPQDGPVGRREARRREREEAREAERAAREAKANKVNVYEERRRKREEEREAQERAQVGGAGFCRAAGAALRVVGRGRGLGPGMGARPQGGHAAASFLGSRAVQRSPPRPCPNPPRAGGGDPARRRGAAAAGRRGGRQVDGRDQRGRGGRRRRGRRRGRRGRGGGALCGLHPGAQDGADRGGRRAGAGGEEGCNGGRGSLQGVLGGGCMHAKERPAHACTDWRHACGRVQPADAAACNAATAVASCPGPAGSPAVPTPLDPHATTHPHALPPCSSRPSSGCAAPRWWTASRRSRRRAR
jgi:hypothetical protein